MEIWFLVLTVKINTCTKMKLKYKLLTTWLYKVYYHTHWPKSVVKELRLKMLCQCKLSFI